jgi:hypothetical protein
VGGIDLRRLSLWGWPTPESVSRFQKLGASAMVDVGGREVAEALVVAAVVVIIDEGAIFRLRSRAGSSRSLRLP